MLDDEDGDPIDREHVEVLGLAAEDTTLQSFEEADWKGGIFPSDFVHDADDCTWIIIEAKN